MSASLNTFHLLMAELLQQYGIQHNASGAKDGNDDVYTLSLGSKLEVHIIGTQENYLNTLCIIPVEQERLEEEQLYTLLSANLFSLDHPIVRVGVDNNRQLVLSSRQAIAELDSSECYRHVELIIQKAQALQEWLSMPEHKVKGDISTPISKMSNQQIMRP
jgi:hypothetical protein